MKLITPIVLAISLFSSSALAQDVYCSELIEYAESELGYGSTVSTYTSEWIQKVKFYSYQGSYVAIAYIKESEYSWRYNKYIFCGISTYNKSMFSSSYSSWGEGFHKYIMPHKCNCR